MNHEEQGPQSEPERLEVLLCAYVLGEADADERREVEAALADSAELRAQRAELERTIGCVRETFDERERMSEAATDALLKRVHDRPRLVTVETAAAMPGWASSPYWRTAAALLFVVGVTGVYRAGRGERMPAVARRANVEDSTSRFEADKKNAVAALADDLGDPAAHRKDDDGLGQESRARLRRVGYVDADESEDAAPEKEGVVGLRELGAAQASAGGAGRAKSVVGSAADDGTMLAGPQSAPAGKPAGDGGEPRGENGLGLATVDPGVALATQPPVARKTPVDVSQEEAPALAGAVALDEFPVVEVEPGTVEPFAAEPSADSITYRWADPALPSEVDSVLLFDGPVEIVNAPKLQGFDVPIFSGGVAAGPGSPGRAYAQQPPREAAPTLSEYAVDVALGASVAPDGGGARGRRAGHAGGDGTDRQAPALVGGDDFFLGRGEREEFRAGLQPADDFRFSKSTQRPLTADEARAWCDRLFQSCRRLPQEQPRDMYFRFWGDNPFELSSADALSTFSVDVDSASYTLARKLLTEGHLPPKAQVRTEEFLNYFEPDVAPPVESTFRVETELAPARFGSPLEGDLWNLRVAVRGRELAPTERRPLALTFVVDVSGSMREEGRLELVKHALRLLLAQLDGNDAIALVAFSREARLVLPMTSARARAVIESAIHPLAPDGGTHAEAGLKMGYEVAAAGFNAEAENRVVFLSDGVANIGQTDQDRIGQDVEHRRARGIYLNTIGVGLANHNDVFLEQLADRGDGKCDYIDSPRAAEKALVENFVGNFQAIARDVKIQVEFDPRQVWKYRLLGYENRAIRDQDFRNDAVDAGEVGAGHQVVALYEVALHSIVDPQGAGASDDRPPLASVHLRWKGPHGDPQPDRVTELRHDLNFGDANADFEQTSAGFRRTVLVAQFAEFLRRSVHARGDAFDDLIAECDLLAQELESDEVREFADLVKRSRTLIAAELARYGQVDRAVDLYRKNCWMLEERRAAGTLDRERLLEMERLNHRMEEQLRELLLEELGH